jgi:hypothetical protein
MFHPAFDAEPSGQAVDGRTFWGEDERFGGCVEFDCLFEVGFRRRIASSMRLMKGNKMGEDDYAGKRRRDRNPRSAPRHKPSEAQ